MSRIPCSTPSTIDSVSESLTLKGRDLELCHIKNMQQLFKSGMVGMATEYLIASQIFMCTKSPRILLVCRFYLRRWGKGLWKPCDPTEYCWFCQAVGHTWVALAAHWNHLGSFTNYWCSGPTLGEAGFNWSGCSLGSRSLKSSLVCWEGSEPTLSRFISVLTFHADLDHSACSYSLKHILVSISSAQNMPSFSKMPSFLNTA